MKQYRSATGAALLAALLVSVPFQAHALFEDADARREIIKLRKQVEELGSKIDSRAPLLEQKADKKSLIDLIGDIEKLRSEMAALRGQLEVLSNELNNAQKRQKDFYNDLDQRLRKLEPQRLSIDGRDVEVDKTEQVAFDRALAEFKAGNHQAANQSFSAFLQRYPESGYLPQAYFWLGSTFFAQQECAKAIPAYQTVATRFPNSQKAPEALLNIASCQLDLKDKGGARETLEQLLKKYPSSTAAGMGKERLGELK
ncbi:MAG: tol-pal system protein YbgF [Oxalobacteraceae bacterium]|jgi:tol-pal system protein YbgF|nr:tol-pal system protein YbgF [Oxalobacteraceae bacterium]